MTLSETNTVMILVLFGRKFSRLIFFFNEQNTQFSTAWKRFRKARISIRIFNMSNATEQCRRLCINDFLNYKMKTISWTHISYFPLFYIDTSPIKSIKVILLLNVPLKLSIAFMMFSYILCPLAINNNDSFILDRKTTSG